MKWASQGNLDLLCRLAVANRQQDKDIWSYNNNNNIKICVYLYTAEWNLRADNF